MLRFFTSRYTALLESQIGDLKKQLAAKDETIASLIQAIRTPEPGQVIPVDGAAIKAFRNAQPNAKQRPPVNNFLQTRNILESASAAGLDVEPAERKEATNG